MAKSDGSVIIDTRMNTSGFQTGVANMKKGFGGLSSALGKIGKLMLVAFSVKQLVQFGKEAIELGSDLSEVQNVVDVTFGNLNEEINEFAKNAIEQFGLSETAAKQYTSTMGAMLKSMGFTTREAADMGKTMTGLAADMASFYNLNAEDAFYKIRAGISGETEPLKQLGINLNVANLEQYALTQGITKSYQAMTQQEQALLRYNYLLKVTSDAQGDFARTSDSWANQTRILTERFKALKATIGQGLINLFTPVIRVINTLLAKLATVANAFKSFTELITGKKSSGTTSQSSAGLSNSGISSMEDAYDSAASGAEDYADATEDAADATKKANKENSTYLSGLDEVRRFESEKNNDEDISGLGSGVADNLQNAIDEVNYGNLADGETVVDQINDKFEKMKEILSGIFQPFKDAWESQGESVINSAKNLFQSLKDTILSIGQTWYQVWASGTGQAYLESIINYVRSLLDMIRSISDAFRNAWNDNGAGYALIESIYTRLTNVLNLLTAIRDSFVRAFSSGIGTEIFSNILGILTGINNIVGNLAAQFLKAWNTAGLGDSIMSNILYLLNIVLSTISKMVISTADWAKTLDFTPLLTSINGLLVALQPLAQNIGDGLAWFYQNVLLPLAGFTIEEIIPRFFETLGSVLTIVNAVLEALQPLFQWFWDNVLQPIAEWTGGIFLQIWDGINTALQAFATWCEENPEFIQNAAIVIGAFFAAFELATIITGVITTIQGLIGIISGAGGLSGVLGTLISALNGPLVIAIGAAIAAGVLLYKNWDTVKEHAKLLWKNVLVPFGNFLKDTFTSIWNNALKPALEFFVTTIIPNVISVFQNLWENYLVPLAEFLGGIFLSAWNDILKPALEYFSNTILPTLISTFENLWNNVLVPLGEFLSGVFKPIFDTLINVLKELWEHVIIPLANLLGTTFKGAFETISNVLNNVVIPAIKIVIDVLKNLWDNFLVPIGNFMRDTFGPIFETVFETIEGIIGGIRNIVNDAIGLVNSAIGFINSAIGGVESAFSFGPWEIPTPFGTKRIGFTANFPRVPTVPYLAKGAVIPPNAPFAAVLGDQKHGTNVEAPLSTIEQAVTNAIKKNGSGGQNMTIRVPVILDGRQIFEAIIDEAKMKQLVSGRNPFEMA